MESSDDLFPLGHLYSYLQIHAEFTIRLYSFATSKLFSSKEKLGFVVLEFASSEKESDLFS